MKYRNLIFAAILVLVSIFFYLMIKMDISREDVGQLTLANYNQSTTYCLYEIVEARPLDENVDAFYKAKDTVCIECCNSDDKTWPPVIQTNQLCYTYITFTSSDGTVEYDADLLDRTNKACTTCPSATGYYACPE